jgi:hypothetical protein
MMDEESNRGIRYRESGRDVDGESNRGIRYRESDRDDGWGV